MNGSLLAANPLQRTEEPEEEPRPGLSLVCTRSRGRAWPHWGCGQSVGHASGLGLPGCCQVTTKVNSLQTKSFPGPHGGQSGPQARGKRQLYAGHTGSQGRVAGRLHSDGGLSGWPKAQETCGPGPSVEARGVHLGPALLLVVGVCPVFPVPAAGPPGRLAAHSDVP